MFWCQFLIYQNFTAIYTELKCKPKSRYHVQKSHLYNFIFRQLRHTGKCATAPSLVVLSQDCFSQRSATVAFRLWTVPVAVWFCSSSDDNSFATVAFSLTNCKQTKFSNSWSILMRNGRRNGNRFASKCWSATACPKCLPSDFSSSSKKPSFSISPSTSQSKTATLWRRSSV